MAGAFAMSVAILRSLPASQAGAVVLVYTLLTVAAVLARFGADNLALREVSKAPDAAGHLIRNVAILALALSGPASALLMAAVFLNSADSEAGLVALAAGIGVFPAAMSIIAGAVLRGLGRVASGAFAELGSPLVIAAIGIAALGLTGRASVLSAVAMISFGYLATALWSWLAVWRLVPGFLARGSNPRGFVRDFRGSLVAFFSSTLGTFLFAWIPVLALGYFIADKDAANSSVAFYNAAARISQFVVLIPTIQISYLSHQFASLHHQGELAAIDRLSQSATKVALLVGVPLSAFMVLLPQVPLAIFGGYSEAATTLRILAVGALLVAAVGPVNGLMMTCGHEKRAGRYTVLLLVVSALLLPPLTRWGAEGVALGSALVSLVYAIACYVTLRKGGLHPTFGQRGRAEQPVLDG